MIAALLATLAIGHPAPVRPTEVSRGGDPAALVIGHPAPVRPTEVSRGGDPAALVIGHSAQGRAIAATRVGDPRAPVRALVVGDVHGNEPAGEAIVARLARERPAGVALWLVRTANPDGRARGTRQNARGVDLNRNFPWRWRPAARGTFYSGPAAGSEPETQALMRLVRRVRPNLAIYYHQHMGIVVRARGADPAVQRAYARRTGLPLRSLPAYRGTAVGWENREVRDGSAFVVELRAGPADARRHAGAVLALARRYLATP